LPGLPDIQTFGYSEITIEMLASKMGRRGAVVLPAKLRLRLGSA
jgi:hypothetical protein